MGYYTYYSLAVNLYTVDPSNAPYPCAPKLLPVPEETITKMNQYLEERDLQACTGEIGKDGYANGEDSFKWYDHEEDMLKMSKEFPEILFELHGIGEESEDFWNKYFLDGKSQFCRGAIVYDDFDPAKLVES